MRRDNDDRSQNKSLHARPPIIEIITRVYWVTEMRQLFAAVLLSLTASGAWASDKGDAGYITNNELYDTCKSPMGDYPCIMFILGVMQGMDAQAYLDKVTDQCIPLSNNTNGDIKNIVTGYLAANKNGPVEPAATSIIHALGTSECKAKLLPLR